MLLSSPRSVVASWRRRRCCQVPPPECAGEVGGEQRRQQEFWDAFEDKERQRTSRRKRKKRWKRRLPKSSSRHPPSSGAHTWKSVHYSTSTSFWQSPVRCPGVARFNSGYSPCVSSRRLWISFIFSTCSWTRILRSFLNLDILPRTPGICSVFADDCQCSLRAPGMWQSLVRCLFSACLARGIQENWNFLGDDSVIFLRPLVSGVLVCLRSACVDSSGRRHPEWFPYSALFGSTVDTYLIREGGPRIGSARRSG